MTTVRQAFVGAAVEDPRESVKQFAKLLGTDVLFEDPDATPGHPVAAVSLGDCMLALYPLPGSSGTQLWGMPITQPRTHVLGLEVRDIGETLERISRSSFEVLWADDPSHRAKPNVYRRHWIRFGRPATRW